MSARFEQETTLQAPRDIVAAAARSFVAESLAKWQIVDTDDGFEARGLLGAHATTAHFRIEPTPSGTRVVIAMLVERAGLLGFMLFDVGGFYDGTLRKWLEGIRLRAGQDTTGGGSPPSARGSPGGG